MNTKAGPSPWLVLLGSLSLLGAVGFGPTSLRAEGTTSQPAVLTVSSEPAGAKVFVNGYYKSRTPVDVAIESARGTPREYTVTLLLPGYAKWQRAYSLVAGERQEVAARLDRLPGAIICLDPGHPSETSAGCRGSTGATENHLNWVIALKLRDALTARGHQVVLTKSSEGQMVTNRRRAEIANGAGADCMVRLHCDAASASGLAVYYPDRQGTKYGVTGPPRGVIQASGAFARAFYPAAMAVLSGQHKGRGVHGDSGTYIGSQQGALTGSIFAKVPVLTVEMCVLTNKTDEAFITSARGQELMAEALVAGLEAGLARLR